MNKLTPFLRKAFMFLFTAALIIIIHPNVSSAVEKKAKRKRHNVRLQYRHWISGEKIVNEKDLQVSFFSSLPYRFFIFSNLETIFSDDTYHSANYELNMSRPFFPDAAWGKALGWITRYQIESKKKGVGSLGGQWYITKTPYIEKIAKKVRLKSFLQTYLIKTQKNQGYSDFLFYYNLTIIDKTLYLRGVNTYYLFTNKKDYISTIHDLILAFNKKWDIYVRFSYYSRIRNNYFSAGIRYLFSF